MSRKNTTITGPQMPDDAAFRHAKAIIDLVSVSLRPLKDSDCCGRDVLDLDDVEVCSGCGNICSGQE